MFSFGSVYCVQVIMTLIVYEVRKKREKHETIWNNYR